MPRCQASGRAAADLPATGDDRLSRLDDDRRLGVRQLSQAFVAHRTHSGQSCDDAPVVNRHESECVVIIAISHVASVSLAVRSETAATCRTTVE